MGAGMDTRCYWDQALKGANLFIEVDAAPVFAIKNKTLEEIKAKSELPEPIVERKTVSIDFSKESTKDLPNHGFNPEVATSWLLEGLVMYLEKDAVDKVYNEISELSAPGSFIILNFTNTAEHHKNDFAQEILEAKGWKMESKCIFGDPEFNYGRYPEGKPANPMCGFAFYKK
mmetsp:Transcript_29339/g.32934  ORF Transcript_29339/g.32934 Transcript_29339/m.32934 type:complete len:173 (+) Transcript_29339:384-902(+)